MNQNDFKSSPSGHLVPTIDNCFAFVPDPLPPRGIDLGRLSALSAEASHAVGELSGIGRTLQDPDILIKPISRAEAVASSKIEGTVTPANELLMLELSQNVAHARSDTREVHNYNRALIHGLRRINEFPFSKRLFCELHTILMQGVALGRGAHTVPGEFRKEQNWIGARTIQNARFVPPPPSEVLRALDALEQFSNQETSDLPLLVQLAMIYYQFETIHPYPDGNGRVGRLLIPLLLGERRAMSKPLLYLSSYFEKHYNSYIDLMLAVSKTGAWEDWISFFLKAVISSAKDAMDRINALQDLRHEYIRRVQTARSSALLTKIIDQLFMIPATTVPYAVDELNVSYNSAKNILGRLTELKIVTPDKRDVRPQWFFAYEIMRVAREDGAPD